MSSAGLSPILPIFCDVCAQDFNSVDTAVTHFTFKKHWTVRNSCVKPAIFIPACRGIPLKEIIGHFAKFGTIRNVGGATKKS